MVMGICERYGLWLAVFVLLSLITYGIVDDVQKVTVCKESHTIEKILSMSHRSVDVLLSNGEIDTVNQGHLELGDEWCVDRERIHKDDVTDNMKVVNDYNIVE